MASFTSYACAYVDLTYICISLGWAARQGNAISGGPISNLSLSPSKFKWQLRFCWTVIWITLANATEFKQLPSFSIQPLSGKEIGWLYTSWMYGIGLYACELYILCNVILAVVYVCRGIKLWGFASCLGSARGVFAFYLEGVFFPSVTVLLRPWESCRKCKLETISVPYFYWSSCKGLFITTLQSL